MRRVSLRDANRNFAKLIAAVEAGEEIVLTRRGRPVVRPSPERSSRLDDPKRRAAYERMVAMLDRGVDLGGLKVNRDELYDRY
jgi:antitoxin (DNA-binding transcriptional repressor) of toxin-antitoxin stability system